MQIFNTREDLENAVITLYRDGCGKRAIARRLKMSRNTIRGILDRHQLQRDQGHSALGPGRVPRSSKLDPHMPRIKALLADFPTITGTRLFEELRDDGYAGGISIVRDRLTKVRPKPGKEPVIRFETLPGEQAQMDWSPYTLDFTREGRQSVLCFSYIMGYSRRHYIDFTRDRTFFTLIRRHQDAFAYFGGVTNHCLYDGEKTVLMRWEAGRPVYNPRFISFITHYRSRPVGCRPGRPQTKGKVEAPFQYIESNLLNARRFEDLEDLRARARWWMAERSDRHVHDKTGRPPIELFLEQEQAALIPLPSHPYDSSQVELRVCRMDGFVEFATNFYSVPFDHVADILALKITDHEVSVYSPELDLVACHERIPDGSAKTCEKAEHRGSAKVRYGLEPVREAFMALGESAGSFLAGLQLKQPRNCGFHARIILAMKATYHPDDINKALRHAATYYAFDGKAVERILSANAIPRSLESYRNEKARERLEKELPRVRQRSLNEYNNLIKEPSS